jgi:hypothetical protein
MDEVNRAATGVAQAVVGVVAWMTVPTMTEIIAGTNFGGDKIRRHLFVITSTPLDGAGVFGARHFALSLTPEPLQDQPVVKARKLSEANSYNRT